MLHGHRAKIRHLAAEIYARFFFTLLFRSDVLHRAFSLVLKHVFFALRAFFFSQDSTLSNRSKTERRLSPISHDYHLFLKHGRVISSGIVLTWNNLWAQWIKLDFLVKVDGIRLCFCVADFHLELDFIFSIGRLDD